MNYTIRRCVECNKEVHIHNKKNRHGFLLRNVCEHIPNGKEKTFNESELRQYLKKPMQF
jgi:hypothetical protein